MEEEWIEKIGKRMRNREVKPLDNLLDDVKDEIEKRNITPVSIESRKMVLTRSGLYKIASFAAILILSICLWRFIPNRNTPQSYFTLNRNSSKTRINKHLLINDLKAKEKAILATVTHIISHSNCQDSTFLKPQFAIPAINEEDSVKIKTDDKDLNHSSVPEDSKQQNTTYILKEKEETYHGRDAYRHDRHNQQKSSISISTYLGGMGGASYSSGGVLLAVAAPIGDYPKDFSGENTSNLVVEGANTEKHIKYHQPIKFGISIRKKINDKWGIQTGITYSRLSSESTSEGNKHHLSEQTLDYIGIPVSASYTIAKGKHYQIYAIAGAEVEKLVNGKEKRNTAPDRKIKETRPQFSINSAIGFEYNLTKESSIYIEPGINHYINNGSSIDNIYKAKPNNFSLNIGFRVHLNR